MYGENEFNRTTQSVLDGNPVIYERMTDPEFFNYVSAAFVNTYAASGFDSREALRIDADIYFQSRWRSSCSPWLGPGRTELDLKKATLSGGEYWRYHYCVGCRLAASQTGANPVAFNEEYVYAIIIHRSVVASSMLSKPPCTSRTIGKSAIA